MDETATQFYECLWHVVLVCLFGTAFGVCIYFVPESPEKYQLSTPEISTEYEGTFGVCVERKAEEGTPRVKLAVPSSSLS